MEPASSVLPRKSTVAQLIEIAQRPVVFLVWFSCAYFLASLGLARERYFDFDELFTLHVGQLPVSRMMAELAAGIEPHPPLSYLLVHLGIQLPGNLEVTARVGSILFFWLCCLSIFFIVRRQAGFRWAALAAMFPCFTALYFEEAYHARAYAMLLGSVAVAYLAWQRATTDSRRLGWLVLLGVSLGVANGSHYYAILNSFPIVLGEIVRLIRNRKIDVPVWIALAASYGVVVSLIPIIIQSRKAYGVVWQQGIYWEQLFHTYPVLFASAIVPTAGALLMAGIASLGGTPRRESRLGRRRMGPLPERVAALAFLLVPFIATVPVYLAFHGGYQDRYFCAVTFGFCLLPPLLWPDLWESRQKLGTAIVLVFLAGMSLQALRPLKRLIANRPLPPIAHSLLVNAPAGQEIVVPDALAFLPLAYYAPPSLANRIDFLAWPEVRLQALGENSIEVNLLGLRRVSRFRLLDYQEFTAGHPQFLLWWDSQSQLRRSWQLERLLTDGFNVNVIAASDSVQLLQVHKP